MFRFVHLSDIHFGQELKAGTIHIHDDARNELLLDVRQQCRLHGNVDGILIIGDTAYSGKKDEYVRAAKWLDDLAEAAGCSKTAVLLIPGNHDVDLNEIDHFGKAVHQLLRVDPLSEVETFEDRLTLDVRSALCILRVIATNLGNELGQLGRLALDRKGHSLA